MTSLLASMFGSASAGSTASRIDTMKAAEKALISFSHRFSWDDYAKGETRIQQQVDRPGVRGL